MKDTIIYLVRHAETVDKNGIRNTNKDSQMINENVKLVYKDDLILNIKSPCLIKLTFRKNELINLEQID